MTPFQALQSRCPNLLEGSLWKNGGWLALDDLLDDEAAARLQEEAASLAGRMVRQQWQGPNEEEWRGGSPARRLQGCPCGPFHNRVFADPAMLKRLAGHCASPVSLAGGGSLAEYCRAGDFLGLHRDILACDVTLIACLAEEGADLPNAGRLRVYSEFAEQPLSAIPEPRGRLGRDVPLPVGACAILLGGVIPHEVTPMAPGQRRLVSLTCYRLDELGQDEG